MRSHSVAASFSSECDRREHTVPFPQSSLRTAKAGASFQGHFCAFLLGLRGVQQGRDCPVSPGLCEEARDWDLLGEPRPKQRCNGSRGVTEGASGGEGGEHSRQVGQVCQQRPESVCAHPRNRGWARLGHRVRGGPGEEGLESLICVGRSQITGDFVAAEHWDCLLNSSVVRCNK